MGLGIPCLGSTQPSPPLTIAHFGGNSPAHHSPSLTLEETALASIECFRLSLCLPTWLSVETIQLRL